MHPATAVPGVTCKHKFNFVILNLLFILTRHHVLTAHGKENENGLVARPKKDSNSNSAGTGTGTGTNSSSVHSDTANESKFVFGIDYKVARNTIPGFRADDDFENWSPPIELVNDLPYYMSGFDKDNQPIWVFELGHWKLGKYLAGGNKEKTKLIYKYGRYVSYLALKSHGLGDTAGKPIITRHPQIVDLEGFKFEWVLNREINAVAEVFLNLARPFLGRSWDKIEIYGTQKSIWAPRFLKHFSKDQIPEKYGGSKGFKPFYVVG